MAPEEAAPVPDVDDGADGRGPVAFTVEVLGELFAVRGGGDDWAYDWVSGPNQGYGFGMSGRADPSMEEHRDHIRGFLAMIDPVTGYIADA